ncbi:MAG: hypothetical protein ABH952_03440 [Candidatus Omnitrophota bacterium]
MSVYIKIVGHCNAGEKDGLEQIFQFKNKRMAYANLGEAAFRLKLDDARDLYLYGEVFYHIKDKEHIKLLDGNCGKYLKKVFTDFNITQAISSLEGQYLGVMVDKKKEKASFFTDRYCRLDYFYVVKGNEFFLGTDLDYIFKNVSPEYDQKMLAHLFSVYGWYTPKGKTIYGNVQRLRVGEILTVSGKGLESKVMEFVPLKIEDYSDCELARYEKLLRESVSARANRMGRTWVSSSSGWDSSILLGLLVDQFGAQNVSMLTGSMKYSDYTETVNSFEINKIKKIGAYFGIKPEIVDLDFKNPKAPDYWKKSLPFYRSKHMYSYVSFNFARLSDKLTQCAGPGQVIFNGETADSFHNFGFSQFATFFHNQKSFTEYADKMNCYLYGPSFLKKVLDGTYEKDKVFQVFKKMNPGCEFAENMPGKKDRIEGLLFPFFYGGPRIPFVKTYVNPAIKASQQMEIYHFPFREYMPEALALSEKDIYSWLIYLYQSFHSQGATVSIQKYSMEYNGHHWRSPFNDYRIIDFLSQAPEHWGRGLDWNHTKYPLKWVAKNRLKFPYDVLDEGPHSYLYDVVEGFSLYAEKTYRSGVTSFFKDMLKTRTYRQVLSDDYFDMRYLDGLVDDYLNNQETRGVDFNNLVSLITLVVTGWY